MNRQDYPRHIFVSFSVGDVREILDEEGPFVAESYPNLSKASDEELNLVLLHCWRCGIVIWTDDAVPDMEELEEAARQYLNPL